MELQEAVRWTEMMRAARTVDMNPKAKDSFFKKFFNKLISTSTSPQREPPGPLFQFQTSHHVGTGASEGRLAITGGSHGGMSSNALVLAKDYQEDGTSDRANQRRREQYRQVRAHVQKEDGRLHAYGWSLPGTKTNPTGTPKNDRKLPKVPVPVYCRPLAEASPHMKVFCAAGVNLNGGYTKDGGCIVGASVFYATNEAQITEITTPTGPDATELDSLDKQMTLAMENSDPDLQLSSYVWICTSTHSASTVTVIDAKNPAVVLDSFPVCQTHLLCICSVQGALEKDYALLENSEAIKSGESLEKPGDGPDDTGKVEFVRVNKKETTTTTRADDAVQSDQNENVCETQAHASRANSSGELTASVVAENDKNEVEIALDSQNLNKGAVTAVVEEINVPQSSPIHLNNTLNNNHSIYSLAFPTPVNPILGSPNPLEEPAMSSVGPTMWLGAQNGMLYVHSSVARWRDCLHQVCLPDAVLSILHVESRVVAALANGKLAIFRRQTDGQWDLSSYHLVTLGLPKQSVRCLCIVADKIWAAHRNKIYIVDPISLNIVHTLEAHPRKESQIRQMAATGLGVWVSIR